ncbi:MAG: glycoside hydrolase family 97 catalytic domain-containing protein [Planctomycetota bacterium]
MLTVCRCCLLLALASASTSCCLAAEVASPDGQLEVTVQVVAGQPRYSAAWRGEALISSSAVGLCFDRDADRKWAVRSEATIDADQTWRPVVGKRANVRDHYRQLSLELVSGALRVELLVRAYDDGFATCCLVPASTAAAVTRAEERNEVRLTGDPTLWFYEKEQAPAGPTRLSELQGVRLTPALAQLATGGYAALHEANLHGSGWLEAKTSPGLVFAGNRFRNPKRGWQTPWRVVQVGDSLADLVDSDVLANLNPKADPDEFAWVKPGVALWDWRSWGYTAPDGFTFGLNLQSWKRFIDFAAEQDVPYVLLDANWYGPEFEKESDPFAGGVSADVRRAITYGKERGVGLILYLNDIAAREHGLEKILKEWSGWGAAGIKYGFMKARKPAEKVSWTRRIVSLCARHRLLVNFHDGPVPPAGCEATFPNWVTREFCHAQSDAKRVFTPTTFLMQMAVNQLAGPIDMNNGMFDLDRSVADRPRVFVEVPATITAEAARTLIVYSGLVVVPDATPVYERHPELFRFISSQKMPWTESKTLRFELGEFITVMRQTGQTYLVGSATNERARELSIPLDFLPAGERFTAVVCEDAPGAHFKTNREAYTTRTIDVDSTSVIDASLAPGGGHCLLISPAE